MFGKSVLLEPSRHFYRQNHVLDEPCFFCTIIFQKQHVPCKYSGYLAPLPPDFSRKIDTVPSAEEYEKSETCCLMLNRGGSAPDPPGLRFLNMSNLHIPRL